MAIIAAGCGSSGVLPTAVAVPTSAESPPATQDSTPSPTASRSFRPAERWVWERHNGLFISAVNDIADAGDSLIAVGGDGRVQAWTSGDGRSWEPADITGDGVLNGVARGSRAFVAMGTSHSAVATWSSVDGRVWKRATDAGALLTDPAFLGSIAADVAAGRGGFVAVGNEWNATTQRPVAWFSDDGNTWSRSAGLDGVSVQAVAYGLGRFIAVGVAAVSLTRVTSRIWTSTDGHSWSALPSPNLEETMLSDVTANASGFVAVGTRSVGRTLLPSVWTSPDGLEWSPAPAGEALSVWPSDEIRPVIAADQVQGTAMWAVSVRGAGFVAVGASFSPGSSATARMVGRGLVWLSEDGRDWRLASHDSSFPRVSSQQPFRRVVAWRDAVIVIGDELPLRPIWIGRPAGT